MLELPVSLSWGAAGLLLLGLIAGGFLVSWVATDLRHVSRTPYIAILAAVAAVSTAVVVAATDAGWSAFLGHRWAAGLAAGAAAGALIAVGLRRVPATQHRHGRELQRAEAWEGVVYGISEGALLSALPAFVGWAAATGAGWSTPAAWGAALGASAVMIAIHHFGYWDFRGRAVLPALGACLILTAAFLASGSLLAPVVGHVILHLAAVTRGVELPPHEHVGMVATPA